MEQLEFLEVELKMMLENIERIKKFKELYEGTKDSWKPSSSHVFGELKHRGIALKQRITLVSSLSTYCLFKRK